MPNSQAFTIKRAKITKDSTFTGRLFYGPYDKTPEFVSELKTAVKEQGLLYEEFTTLSVYYSDPEDTAPEKLASFHGVLTHGGQTEDEEFGAFDFSVGEYLVYNTNSSELIWHAFFHIYEYAGRNNIFLSEAPPLLLSSFENNQTGFSFYFMINR